MLKKVYKVRSLTTKTLTLLFQDAKRYNRHSELLKPETNAIDHGPASHKSGESLFNTFILTKTTFLAIFKTFYLTKYRYNMIYFISIRRISIVCSKKTSPIQRMTVRWLRLRQARLEIYATWRQKMEILFCWKNIGFFS